MGEEGTFGHEDLANFAETISETTDFSEFNYTNGMALDYATIIKKALNIDTFETINVSYYAMDVSFFQQFTHLIQNTYPPTIQYFFLANLIWNPYAAVWVCILFFFCFFFHHFFFLYFFFVFLIFFLFF